MTIDPLRFAVLLPTLLVAHNVADHVIQTDHQAADKMFDWQAMAGHVGSYTATQVSAMLAISRLTGIRLSCAGAAAGVAFSALSHGFIDRRWPVRAALRATRSPKFADMTTPLHGMYLADQALHHGCLFVAALLMARR